MVGFSFERVVNDVIKNVITVDASKSTETVQETVIPSDPVESSSSESSATATDSTATDSSSSSASTASSDSSTSTSTSSSATPTVSLVTETTTKTKTVTAQENKTIPLTLEHTLPVMTKEEKTAAIQIVQSIVKAAEEEIRLKESIHRAESFLNSVREQLENESVTVVAGPKLADLQHKLNDFDQEFYELKSSSQTAVAGANSRDAIIQGTKDFVAFRERVSAHYQGLFDQAKAHQQLPQLTTAFENSIATLEQFIADTRGIAADKRAISDADLKELEESVRSVSSGIRGKLAEQALLKPWDVMAVDVAELEREPARLMARMSALKAKKLKPVTSKTATATPTATATDATGTEGEQPTVGTEEQGKQDEGQQQEQQQQQQEQDQQQQEQGQQEQQPQNDDNAGQPNGGGGAFDTEDWERDDL